jgi:hypothetical protein
MNIINGISKVEKDENIIKKSQTKIEKIIFKKNLMKKIDKFKNKRTVNEESQRESTVSELKKKSKFFNGDDVQETVGNENDV